MPTNKKAAPLSLRQNFIYTVVGDTLFNACQWAMIATLAKIGNAHMVGQYALALAINAPIFLFTNLGLRAVQATESQSNRQFGEYVALRLSSIVVGLSAVIGLCAILHFDKYTILVILIMSIARLFDSLSDLIYGLLQKNERMDYISISRVTQGVLQLTTLAMSIKLTGSLVWAACVVAITSGLVTIFYDLRMASRVINHAATPEVDERLGFSKGVLKGLLPVWNTPSLLALTRLSLPLGLVAVLAMLNANIPRYFISNSIGIAELGIFSAMWSILHPIGMVTGALIQSVMPRAARYYVDDIKQYQRMMLVLLLCAGANGVLGIVVARFAGTKILTLLFRPEYARYPTVFLWIMIAATFYYLASVLGGFISAARCFKPQLVSWIIIVAVNAIACFVLIPKYGMLGAAWAYTIGCIVWLISYMAIIVSITARRSGISSAVAT